jgi:hypothetical protein
MKSRRLLHLANHSEEKLAVVTTALALDECAQVFTILGVEGLLDVSQVHLSAHTATPVITLNE